MPSLTSDGRGYVDTGYRYHRSDSPKTKRIVLKLYNSTNGYKQDVTGTTCDFFGVFGKDSQQHSYFRFQRGSARFTMYGGGDANVSSTAPCYGDAEISLDYFSKPSVVGSSVINGPMMFTGDSLAAPTADATETYYLFGNHNYSLTDQAWNPSYYQLQEFQIYETGDEGVTETLAHDFVPAKDDDGRAGVFDCVTGDMRYPAGEGTEAGDGFVLGNVKWRLRYNGCVSYHPAGEVLRLASTRAAGYLLVDDKTLSFDAVGDGPSYGLTMPGKAVSFYWTEDRAINPGETMSVDGTEAVRNLTLSAGSGMSFSTGAELLVAGDVTLPADGTVRVSLSGAAKSGDHVIMRGLTNAIDVSKLVAGTIGEKGCSATFEQVGSTLVLHACKGLILLFR